MKRVKRFLIRAFWLNLFIRTRAYFLWSRIWRWYESRYDWPPVARFRNIVELNDQMKTYSVLWTKDTWWRLFDTTSRPERLQARIFDHDREPAPPIYGVKDSVDCDEFATYCAAALREMDIRGDIDLIHGPHLLQVVYEKATGPLGLMGHSVCVFSLYDGNGGAQAFHISNWGLRELGFGPLMGESRESREWPLHRAADDVGKGGKWAGVAYFHAAWYVNPKTLRLLGVL